MLSCFIVLVSCIISFFLPNQNNPTAVWLRLIGMHNEKHDFSYLFLQMNSSYIAQWFSTMIMIRNVAEHQISQY